MNSLYCTLLLFFLSLGCLSLECPSDKSHMLLQRNYDISSEEETFTIYQGNTVSGTEIFTSTPDGSLDYESETFELCVSNGLYTVKMEDDYGDGWGDTYDKSDLVIYVNHIFVLRTSMTYLEDGDYYSITKTFYVDSPLNLHNTYSYTFVGQSDHSWASSPQPSWSTASVDTISMDTNLITRYFLKQITLDTPMSDIATLGVSIRTKAGYILYVNGEEVVRHRLPSGSIGSDTISISSNDYSEKIHYVTVPKSYFSAGSTVLIGIETHQRQSTNSDLNFDMAATIIRSYDNVYRSIYGIAEGDFDCNPDGDYYGCKQLVDEYSTSSYYTTQDYFTFTYSLPDGIYEWINSYIFISPEFLSDGDPTDWTLSGSLDKSSWDTLDLQSQFSFNNRFQVVTFNLPSNGKVYKHFKFEFSGSTQSSISLTDLILTTAYVEPAAVSLSYPESTLTPYVNVDTINIAPVNTNYNSFSVQPPLSEGLILNTSTGRITGKVTIANTVVYEITGHAVGTQTPSTFSLTIAPLLCEQPSLAAIQLVKVNSYTAGEETYVVSSLDNQVLFQSEISTTQNVNVTKELCLPAEIIRVTLYDSYGDRWSTGSFLYVNMITPSGIVPIAQLTLAEPSTESFLLNLKYALAPSTSTWKFYDSSIPTNWYSQLYTDSAWTTLSTTTTSSSTHWLFRSSFEYTSNPQYVAFEMGIRIQGGFILYINGKEYTREYLSDTDTFTTSTTTTNPKSEPYMFYITGPISLFYEGINLISIALVNPQSTTNVFFEAYMMPLIHPSVHSRFFESTITTTPISTTDAYRMVDYQYKTYWSVAMYSMQELNVLFTMPENRREFFNKFCLSPARPAGVVIKYQPIKSWKLQVSNDNQEFTTVHDITDFEFGDDDRSFCFYPPYLTKPFRYIKFTMRGFAQSTTEYSIGEVGFLVEKIDYNSMPPFTITPDIVSTFAKMNFPTVTVSSPYYSQFEATPALPAGLSLNPYSGQILGTIDHPIDQTYNVSALNPMGERVYTSLSLMVIMCSYPATQFSVFVKTSNYGYEMSYELKNSNGDIIHSVDPFGNNREYSFVFCAPSDVYTLTLKDSRRDGWDSSYISVYNDLNELLFTGTMPNQLASIDYHVEIGYLVSYTNTLWSFYEGEVSHDWMMPSSTPSWSQYYPVQFPTPSQTTQYYRTTFEIESFNSAGYDFTVRTRGGVIAYLNGVEIFRANLPEGEINQNTFALTNYEHDQTYGLSLAHIKFNTTVHSYVYSIEIHQPFAQANWTMYGAVMKMNNGSWRSHDGTASDDLKSKLEDVIQLFDNREDTYFASGPRCIGASYTYHFQNQKQEFVNSYSITTGPNCNKRHPTSWIIEGSNDEKTWVPLHITENVAFTQYKQTNSYSFYNENSYRSIRFTALQCDGSPLNGAESSTICNMSPNGDQGFQLSEIGYYSVINEYSCAPANGYGGSLNDQYGFRACPQYYNGRIQSYCRNGVYEDEKNYCTPAPVAGIAYSSPIMNFRVNEQVNEKPVVAGVNYTCTCSKELPKNLELLSDGTIVGKPKEEILGYALNVTCSNRAGSFSQEIIVSIYPSNALPVWVIVIIVVLVVILVLLVVICMVKRMSSKKKLRSVKHSTPAPQTSKNVVKV